MLRFPQPLSNKGVARACCGPMTFGGRRSLPASRVHKAKVRAVSRAGEVEGVNALGFVKANIPGASHGNVDVATGSQACFVLGRPHPGRSPENPRKCPSRDNHCLHVSYSEPDSKEQEEKRGGALVSFLLCRCSSMIQVKVLSRSKALGYTGDGSLQPRLHWTF